MVQNISNPGLGLGLRSKHFNYILENKPAVDWFEVISENFMDSGGRPRHILRELSRHYPFVMHGVSMSIGSSDPLDIDYLSRLKALAAELQPLWVSDHLCWTGINGLNSHDLLPLPLTEESLNHVAERILRVQDFLQRPLILENPSTYLSFKNTNIPENIFLSELVKRTDCGLLLDVNNVYVSAYNNDFDPIAYIESLPFDSIVQLHLAGHQNCGDYIIDTHDHPVINEVWKLFHLVWKRTGGTAVLLEWDSNIPEFEEYHAELLKCKRYMDSLEFSTETETDAPVTEAQISTPVEFIIPEKIYI